MYENFYKALYRIRRVEEEIARIYPTDKIKSPIHLSIGQEAIAVGVCGALREDDVIFGSYRGHAQYLAKGGDLNGMIAELFGKFSGCAKGKGGSMHLADVQHGVIGTSAIVGTTIANAVGYAYAMKYLQLSTVVVSFFGDGAVDEGGFHESLNFAALKNLPILFICENNGYAIHSPQLSRQAKDNITERAASYGLSAARIENNDVLEIFNFTQEAVDAIRIKKTGPVFLECKTYRLKEHVGPSEDYNLGYRSLSEAEIWIKNDPLTRLANLIPEDTRLHIEAQAEMEISQAFIFAENSPFPNDNELFTDIMAED